MEVGGVFYVRRAVTVRAVQLSEHADWAAVAQWCGGTLVELVEGRERALWLNGGTAILGWWVIRGVTEHFFVRCPEQFECDYSPTLEGGSSPSTASVSGDGCRT